MVELRVLYADNHLLVVVKPPCVPVVPDESGDESLLEAARGWVEREFSKPGRAFLGVVQRLDRPVGGIVVLARTSKAARRLTESFRERRVEKTYWAVGEREPREAVGRMEQWLRKDRARNVSRVVRPEARGSRRAVTRWRVLARRSAPGVLMEMVPETGRSHQLRLAAASLGAPLLGDLKYGASRALGDRSIALFARAIVLRHPTRDERLEFCCEPPRGPVWRFEGAG